MKLFLDPADLKPEYREEDGGPALSSYEVEFEHFTEEVQTAIVAVGQGTYRNWDRSNHELIYAPESHTDE